MSKRDHLKCPKCGGWLRKGWCAYCAIQEKRNVPL